MSLKKRYREAIQPKLLKDLNFSNMHQVPKVLKVTVNRGLGEAAQNAKSLELRAAATLCRIHQGGATSDGSTAQQRAEARSRLQDTFNWFTEGFESRELREAKTLIGALGDW